MSLVADKLPRLGWRAVTAYSLIFVVVPILTYFIGELLDRILMLPKFPPFPINLVIGFSVFTFGLAIGIKSTRLLYHKGHGLPWGEVKHKAQSTRLVTTRLYAYCRHPMTFGYSLLPCGMGILFRSPTMTILIPAIIFSMMIIWLKLREEPRLEQRFGQRYRDYQRQTPFLIPRFKPLLRDLASPAVDWLRCQKTEVVNAERADYPRVQHSVPNPMRNGQHKKAKEKTYDPETSKMVDKNAHKESAEG